MNEKSLCRDLDAIMHFVDKGLGLDRQKNGINGFTLTVPITESAAYNTYIETIGNKADILYLRIKKSLISMVRHAYLEYIKRLSKKFELNKKSVILAFDYTEEDFYGDAQGFDIHGWTKKDAITGKFKFLTCSIISDEIPQKIPLISTPIRIGHYKSHEVLYCLSLIKNYIGKIRLILFDREFYNNDLMYELTKMEYPFLIFVKKFKEYKNLLEELEEKKTIFVHDYTVNKNQSKYKGENYLAFLKQIYDPRSDKNYDWIFATNVEKVVLSDLLITYKKRWRIETQFRVQDEAKIRCKSKDMRIRYFFFLLEQLLQVTWICFHDRTPFKKFLIELAKISRRWTKT